MVASVDADLRELDKFCDHDLDSIQLFHQNLGTQLFVSRKDTQALEDPQLVAVGKSTRVLGTILDQEARQGYIIIVLV